MKDKDLIKKLKSLRNTEAGGKPQGSWVMENKSILMSQIGGGRQEIQEEKSSGKYYFQFFAEVFGNKVLKPVGGALLLVVVYFTYSAGMSMANASLPGDMLYPIKTVQEKVQMALTFSDDKKVQLQMNIVTKRADELQALSSKPDSADKKANMASTVKKISSDIKEVKTKFDKINQVASPEFKVSILSLAKEVDDKTLIVEKTLVDTHKTLTGDTKKELAKDVKEAIASAEATGASALTVIVKNYNEGGKDIADNDVASRVAERIKTTEETIAVAVSDANKLASSTSATSTIEAKASSTTVASETTAKASIEAAKDLLDQKDFTSAIAKIQESKDIVGEIIEKTQSIDIISVTSTNSTTTGK